MIRLLIVDDHEVVRSGIRMMLLAEDDIEIVGEAGNGVEALELTQSLRPDVVIMDVQMPEMNGIEATRAIKATCSDCAVLALTIHEDEQYFFQMLDAGALGYVPKRAAADELLQAIHAVYEGHMFLYSSMAALMVSERGASLSSSVDEPPLDAITEREQEVLKLIADGLMNQQIADELNISTRTVERHRENIMNKLDLHSRTELIKYAIRQGLVDLN